MLTAGYKLILGLEYVFLGLEYKIFCKLNETLIFEGYLRNLYHCFPVQEKFLTPEWVQRFEDNISSAPVLIVDANLSNLALKASCKCKCL